MRHRLPIRRRRTRTHPRGGRSRRARSTVSRRGVRSLPRRGPEERWRRRDRRLWRRPSRSRHREGDADVPRRGARCSRGACRSLWGLRCPWYRWRDVRMSALALTDGCAAIDATDRVLAFTCHCLAPHRLSCLVDAGRDLPLFVTAFRRFHTRCRWARHGSRPRHRCPRRMPWPSSRLPQPRFPSCRRHCRSNRSMSPTRVPLEQQRSA